MRPKWLSWEWLNQKKAKGQKLPEKEKKKIEPEGEMVDKEEKITSKQKIEPKGIMVDKEEKITSKQKEK